MNHTVLLLDDDSNVLEGLARAMRKQPYQIVTATNGDEALAILESSPVDVLICDEQMPGLSGTEFLAMVAREYPYVVRMMLTGHADAKLWQRAINEGAIYRFFCKPCDEVELFFAIRNALRQRDAQPSLVQTAGGSTR